ncbi:MAG: glycosyltransferase [Flavobacterium sp.]|nr:MAG: glycosyltransferase [Flavobacterium sp.]
MSNFKILFCLHHFLPEWLAGTEMYVLALAKYLRNNKVSVIVLIPNFGKSKTEEYIYESVRVIKYAENSNEDRNMILGKVKPQGLPVFLDIVKEVSPDIIHFHELAPGRGINIFHVEACHAIGIPIVLTFHLSHYSCFSGDLFYRKNTLCHGEIHVGRCTKCAFAHKGLNNLTGNLLKSSAMLLYNAGINTTKWPSSLSTALAFPFVIEQIQANLEKLAAISQKIVVLTNWYEKILLKNGVPKDKLVRISQGTIGDLSSINQIHNSVMLPIKIVFVGRISPLKGLHILISAIKSLNRSSVELDIYGNEKDADYVEYWKHQTKGLSNIRWKGQIQSGRVVQTIQKYHILCLPSTFSEMSPLVIQEAFAAGLPVLASNVYGNSEQIDNEINGWLFKYNDVNDLTQKLHQLIAKPSLIEDARLHIPAVKSFSKVAAQHLRLYESILNKKNTNIADPFFNNS